MINRMGFNNRGQPGALQRLVEVHRTCTGSSASTSAPTRTAPTVSPIMSRAFGRWPPVADYLTINISSPNTPGLRGLQDEGALEELLAAVQEVGSKTPIFLKVAPDLADGDPERIVRAALDHGIDAIIVSNTTMSRPPLKSRHAGEAGGLSGAPIKAARARSAARLPPRRAAGEIPLIGVGGIANADDAWERDPRRREPGPAVYRDGL